MATVLFRRLRGGIYQASTFSSAVRCSQKRTPNERGKVYAFHLPEDRKPESVKGHLSRVLDTPSAYGGLMGCGRHERDECKVFPLGNVYSTNAKQIHNTRGIACARGIACTSTKSNILDVDMVQPKRKAEQRDDDPIKGQADKDLIETYSSKDKPRSFQQQRPEYKSMCYSKPNQFTATSVKEGQDLLNKAATLKSGLTPAAISTCFEKLSYLPAEEIAVIRTSAKFAILCRYGVENIKLFSATELLNILGAFIRLEIPSAHSMLNAYQTEFSCRVWNMTTEELLLAADMWRYLGRSVPQFLDILYSFMQLRCRDLTLPQVVQLIYIIGEGRRAPEQLMRDLENMVLRYLDSISVEEIGVICLGFFKSQNVFSGYLMRRIGHKVSENMNEISNAALVSVLKMIRFTHVDHLHFMNRLGQVAPQRIPSMGVQGIMHVALSCTAVRYLDENIMNAVAAVLPDRISYCRSKDLAKFLWSFGVLNYEPPNAELLYVTVTDQIRKMQEEFVMFPEHFLTSLLGLVFVGRFPVDLIEIALSDRFVELATKSQLELKKDLFTLAGSVETECPHYTGKHLSPELRQEVTEMMENFASQDSCVRAEVVEAAGLLASLLGGPKYVKNHTILPHTRSSDLEIHLDASGKPIPINDISEPSVTKLEFKPHGLHITDDLLGQLFGSNKEQHLNTEGVKEQQNDSQKMVFLESSNSSSCVPITEDLLSALTSSETSTKNPVTQPKLLPDITKLAVQVSNRNHYCYSPRRHMLGLHSMKRRQLRRLGYTVVELSYWEWFPLLKRTKYEKLAYLREKLFGSLDSR